MNAKKITLILIPINIILAFFVYDSISSEVEFNKLAKERIAENVQKLKDLRTLQIAYKRENEVFADNFADMERQALKINSWGKNIYVKIPVVNSKGKFTGQLIKKLNKKKIKLNITAVYTVAQVRKINKCLDNKSKSIISIFAGRMSDTGIDPWPIMKKAIQITNKKN